MSLLSLDIRELPVRLRLGEAPPVPAALFLHRLGPRGEESLLERLNGPDPFLPFRWDDRIQLVARTAIAWLECFEASPEDPDGPDRSAPPQHLHVRLRGGTSLTGAVQAMLPAHHNRLLDFLNQKETFFGLTARNGLVAVNKAWIESVEPLKDNL